jgi:hypothetical protein
MGTIIVHQNDECVVQLPTITNTNAMMSLREWVKDESFRKDWMLVGSILLHISIGIFDILTLLQSIVD